MSNLDVEPIIRNNLCLRLKFFKCPRSKKTVHAKTCINTCEIYPICEKLLEVVNNYTQGERNAVYRKNKGS